MVFLDLNGRWLDAPDDEVYDLVVAVASGTADLHEIASALRGW